MQCIVKDSRYHAVMLFMRITIFAEIFCNVFPPIFYSGQFWGRFMLGRSLPDDQHVRDNDKLMSVFDGRTPKSFTGFVDGSWNSYHEQCFFAGDRQGYRVIEGQYGCYEVDEIFSTQFSTKCSIECSKVPSVKCSKRFSTECSKDCPHSKFEVDKCAPRKISSGSGL